MDYRRCQVISTDDHVMEDKEFFQRWLPAAYRDQAPRVQPGEDGIAAWVIGTERRPIGVAAVGATADRTVPCKTWEEIPTITYVPAERIKAMDQDGVDVHTLFPNGIGFAGAMLYGIRDAGLRLACVRAYNDYLAEEWHGFSPRFVVQAIVPMWDAEMAVAEFHRAVGKGHKALVMPSHPQTFGMPHLADPAWDPLWSAVQEADLPVELHIGSGKGSLMGQLFPKYSGMQRLAISSTQTIATNTQVMADLLMSGILERFPRLRFISVESGLGWVPYLLEVADHQYGQQRLWREAFMTMKPSDYFHRQCYVNFWFEKAGIAMRHFIGVENILWESDFPHPTCTYPNSRRYIENSLGDVPEDERRKILVENAVRVFRLD